MLDGQSDLLLVQEKNYRFSEKLEAIRLRLEVLEVEKANLKEEVLKEKLKARDNNANKMMHRRHQSPVYKRLNPVIDYEMNYDEFQTSLQQVNNNLLNKKECDYIYHVSLSWASKIINL